HQSYPNVGYAMGPRGQRRDAEILKRELGVNLVRTSHYPQSPHFLDACDELGLLVFEELPGWQHIGDLEWQANALSDLRSMIERDRNRPSVVLWGVRINESQDSHDFYAKTNALARELDPTRARGGVRYIEGSEFLEDVYTFNDFSYAGERGQAGRARPTDRARRTPALKAPRRVTRLGRDLPFLVTEHMGHMFPTKRFDNEERLYEHALRHARVLDAAYGDPKIAGAIGWCAFDYNTHKDFGSGDRVCYHGVSDMFRIPKYAAFVYASQVEPSERVVLEAASLFAKGERSAAAMLPIHVWTNCDEVVLFRSGSRVGSYFPDRATFPHLPHPPVVIRDLIGDRLEKEGFSKRDQAIVRELVGIIFSEGMEALIWRDKLRMGLLLARKRMSFTQAEELISRLAVGWGEKSDTYELVGLVKGREVARRLYGGDAYAARLELRADDEKIEADGIDATRCVLRLLDQYGNIQPFASEAVELSIEGPASIVGPSLLSLVGGVAAFWVRSGIETGEVRLKARGSRFAATATIACELSGCPREGRAL
ncbi:MAG: glycoside hydrolase family 2 protein, partial [Treponema sp.]|nr:glycoside hydrolase family 2 protein [Treponema sp.]